MAKDPRFNFYPDNYMGGTIGFTLEQHGAYMQLLIMNSKVGKFTEEQALNHLASLTRGNTAVYTVLWQFLLPKFAQEGNLFFSERLMKEMDKSKNHSKLQSDRISKRWNKEKDQSGKGNGNTTVLPVNRTGSGNGIESNERIRGAGEKENLREDLEEILPHAIDDILIDQARLNHRTKDVDAETKLFLRKCSPRQRVTTITPLMK